MNLSEISHTALLALTCRAVVSEKQPAVFNDPRAVLCLERLLALASAAEQRRIRKWQRMYTGLGARDATARARTARQFDDLANQYIAQHPGCTVINLGCGLDTRFWRIEHEKCRYIELDLPEVIALKRELLHDQLPYELIGGSVLDPAWIEPVTANGNRHFLLLAEALVYYLPKPAVIGLLQTIAGRFDRSQLVLDMAPEKYTRGLWKWMIQLEARVWDIDVGFVSGINHPRELEAYDPGLKVIGEVQGSVGPIITVSINAP